MNCNKEMFEYGKSGSIIRELHAYGEEMAKRVGEENVFDFSIGNPAVPAPPDVKKAILEQLEDTSVHDYTSAEGRYETRAAVAKDVSTRFETCLKPEHIYLTSGAAAALAIVLNAVCEEGDEVILFAPYFPEYNVYATAAKLKPVVVQFDGNFQINFDDMKSKLSAKTKAVIVNSPNNPSGAIYSRETIERLAKILSEHSEKIGHAIYIISDEPYRELTYNGEKPPYIPNVYEDAIVCYSYSKSLSLPGERIGYVAVNSRSNKADEIMTAIRGAGRALGYINASSLFQRVIEKCVGILPDLSFYRTNRDILFEGLKKIGYECAPADGAFYLFVKAPNGSSIEFSERAKALGVIVAPGNDFAAPAYFRLAYCVPTEKIKASLPIFKRLYDSYQ